mgnify:CR=1 FL=1
MSEPRYCPKSHLVEETRKNKGKARYWCPQCLREYSKGKCRTSAGIDQTQHPVRKDMNERDVLVESVLQNLPVLHAPALTAVELQRLTTGGLKGLADALVLLQDAISRAPSDKQVVRP